MNIRKSNKTNFDASYGSIDIFLWQGEVSNQKPVIVMFFFGEELLEYGALKSATVLIRERIKIPSTFSRQYYFNTIL